MSPSVPALCVALCLVSYTTGSDIVFTSTPSAFKEFITDELRLRCSLRDSASSVVVGKRDLSSDTAPTDVNFVTSITITKAGVDVATISEHLSAKVFGNPSDVEVTGQISGNGVEKGFLEVTWKFPGSAQAGSYKCDVRGLEQSGHGHDFSETLDVAENEVSLSDIVGQIHQLKLKNADLQKSNAVLKTKVDTHVMFTTYRNGDITLSNGQVLVFNVVEVNTGSGYSSSTGVFTAPVSGYYKFDVHITGQDDEQVMVSLQHNGSTVIGAFADDDGGDNNSGSTSAVIYLRQKDTVKVVSWQTSYVFGGIYTSFTGQLIFVG